MSSLRDIQQQRFPGRTSPSGGITLSEAPYKAAPPRTFGGNFDAAWSLVAPYTLGRMLNQYQQVREDQKSSTGVHLDANQIKAAFPLLDINLPPGATMSYDMLLELEYQRKKQEWNSRFMEGKGHLVLGAGLLASLTDPVELAAGAILTLATEGLGTGLGVAAARLKDTRMLMAARTGITLSAASRLARNPVLRMAAENAAFVGITDPIIAEAAKSVGLAYDTDQVMLNIMSGAGLGAVFGGTSVLLSRGRGMRDIVDIDTAAKVDAAEVNLLRGDPQPLDLAARNARLQALNQAEQELRMLTSTLSYDTTMNILDTDLGTSLFPRRAKGYVPLGMPNRPRPMPGRTLAQAEAQLEQLKAITDNVKPPAEIRLSPELRNHVTELEEMLITKGASPKKAKNIIKKHIAGLFELAMQYGPAHAKIKDNPAAELTAARLQTGILNKLAQLVELTGNRLNLVVLMQGRRLNPAAIIGTLNRLYNKVTTPGTVKLVSNEPANPFRFILIPESAQPASPAPPAKPAAKRGRPKTKPEPAPKDYSKMSLEELNAELKEARKRLAAAKTAGYSTANKWEGIIKDIEAAIEPRKAKAVEQHLDSLSIADYAEVLSEVLPEEVVQKLKDMENMNMESLAQLKAAILKRAHGSLASVRKYLSNLQPVADGHIDPADKVLHQKHLDWLKEHEAKWRPDDAITEAIDILETHMDKAVEMGIFTKQQGDDFLKARQAYKEELKKLAALSDGMDAAISCMLKRGGV